MVFLATAPHSEDIQEPIKGDQRELRNSKEFRSFLYGTPVIPINSEPINKGCPYAFGNAKSFGKSVPET